MLYTKFTNCTNCIDIKDLICEIDTKIFYYADSMYNNLTLLTTSKIDKEVYSDLLYYKRILTARLFNQCYANSVNITDIISRVKILIYK
jgi:hypothetical protein